MKKSVIISFMLVVLLLGFFVIFIFVYVLECFKGIIEEMVVLEIFLMEW